MMLPVPQAEEILRANEARLQAADEKKARGLFNVRVKVCLYFFICLLTHVSGV